MNGQTHKQIAGFIWSICNLLRGPYKRNEYRKVILLLTVLRRFECLLQPTRKVVLKEFQSIKTQSPRIQQARLQAVSGYRFYTLSKLQFTPSGEEIHSLLDDPNNLPPNLNSYINAFSPNVRAIMEKFKFSDQIAHMAEKNILFEVIKAFSKVDLSPQRVDQMQMGYVFEELIRIGAEQSNEEAGEHFTPREVIKRRRIGDPQDKEKDPDHIADITRIYGNFTDGETRTFTIDSKQKELVVSKVFDNEDFGYHKITVERPLRLNFLATTGRIDRLEEQTAFKNIASSKKKNETVRQQEIEAGKARQQVIRDLLAAFAAEHGAMLFKDRKEFLLALREVDRRRSVKLSASELKAVLAALGERDETAEICRDRKGAPEPDADLRDTETVPLKESIEEYFRREVLPHVPDAWIDHSKTKVGYEIPLNRHFYRYEPPRELEAIEADIKELEGEIVELLREVTA